MARVTEGGGMSPRLYCGLEVVVLAVLWLVWLWRNRSP